MLNRLNLHDLLFRVKITALALSLRFQRKANREILFAVAEAFLGHDASPLDIASDELGCAETVNEIHTVAFGYPIGGDVSTTRLYTALLLRGIFRQVYEPQPGDIVLSPTGFGNGKIKHGHTGFVGRDGKIMSNSSESGRFLYNYTLDSWRDRYVVQGGYPMLFFRRV